MVIPITDRNLSYAEKVYRQLRDHSIRAELEKRSEGVGKKIRDAELQKIPYIIIIGDEEEKLNNISFRIHKKGDKGQVDLSFFIEGLVKLILKKESEYEIL